MAVQSLVIVRNACAHVGGPENFGDSAGVPLGRWGPLGWGAADPLKTCFSPTRVTMPISIILRQTVSERNDGDIC